jgi:hypothetical protein
MDKYVHDLFLPQAMKIYLCKTSIVDRFGILQKHDEKVHHKPLT